MAGIDYVSCHECGKRLFYDGEGQVREYLHVAETAVGLTCAHCVDKLKKKIEELKKRDRRRH